MALGIPIGCMRTVLVVGAVLGGGGCSHPSTGAGA